MPLDCCVLPGRAEVAAGLPWREDCSAKKMREARRVKVAGFPVHLHACATRELLIWYSLYLSPSTHNGAREKGAVSWK